MDLMSNVSENFPDISFIDNETIENVMDQMINDFQSKYKEITGNEVSLAKADPYRMIIYACSVQIYQAMQYLDRAGKQSFLKYAYGDFLDNLAALRGIKRLAATAANATIKFTTDTEKSSAISIPAGTRVTPGNEVYFYTTEYAEIPAGKTEVEVDAKCTETGTTGNGYRAGEINILVDILPFIQTVSNTALSQGGSNVESDSDLADRIYLAASSYSVAGPADAYAYWVKSVNSKICDVKVSSPEPVHVDIRFILEDGEIPEDSLIRQVEDFISDNDIRPLTDKVTVKAPDIVESSLSLSYFINESDRSSAATIRQNVNNAIEEYVIWQKSKIGRDINPSYLVNKVIEAGAKRVEITTPVFTVIPDTSLAKITAKNIIYGGIEND